MSKIKKLILYIIFYMSGLWMLITWMNRKKILILMYHGVSEADSDIWTQIKRAEFEKQMAFIGKKYNVVPLKEAVAMLRGERPIQDYTASITFDDGFKNNKTIAYPILKKHSLPATIFLTTSFLDYKTSLNGLLWPDYIYCLLQNSRQEELDLSDLGMGLMDLSGNSNRIESINYLCEHLKTIDYIEKNRIIDTIIERINASLSEQTTGMFQGMNWEDVIELDSEGLISFGAHTVSHEILSRMPEMEIKKEIADSKLIIEQKIGKAIDTFAYPNGNRSDFNETAKQTSKSLFQSALTTIEGLNSINCDLYEIKRVGPGSKMKMWEFKLLISRSMGFIYLLKSYLKQ